MKRNIMITGSTDGIGRLTAARLAKKGHAVYLHGRSDEKLDAAVSEVKSVSGIQNVSGFTADLSNLDAVKHMAGKITSDLPEMDILINNAGILKNWSSADKGADILYELALSDAHGSMTGEYFDNDQGRYGLPHPDAVDTAKIERLIRVTETLIS